MIILFPVKNKQNSFNLDKYIIQAQTVFTLYCAYFNVRYTQNTRKISRIYKICKMYTKRKD